MPLTGRQSNASQSDDNPFTLDYRMLGRPIMPNLPFTLRQLDIFSSLATTRSFRRSAEQLGISQASVSNQIKALEEQLGVMLFDRAPGRRPILRPDGMAFLEDLRQFHRAAEVLAGYRRKVAEPVVRARRFRVLVGQGMFDGYIRRKLDVFYAEHPYIELVFEAQLPFGQIVRGVERGQFDFALINQRADQPHNGLFSQLAVVHGGIYGHRKFAEGKTLPLPIHELNRLPFILPNASSKQEREVMLNFEGAGIYPRHVVGHTQYYDVMAAMLERGLGIASFSSAILPASMRRDVVLLYPMQDWRLLWYRKDSRPDAQAAAAEHFLVTSVIDDPDYPALSRNWPQ
jgi:DNA-binding transcriptional LysR family regulator